MLHVMKNRNNMTLTMRGKDKERKSEPFVVFQKIGGSCSMSLNIDISDRKKLNRKTEQVLLKKIGTKRNTTTKIQNS